MPRIITPRSIVFLDEFESSLHPQAVVAFLQMLYELSQSGMQFFIAAIPTSPSKNSTSWRSSTT